MLNLTKADTRSIFAGLCRGDDMRDIGKNIRYLRESKGLTQDQLAEKLFVTRQTVSNYETGRTRPDVDMIVSICNDIFNHTSLCQFYQGKLLLHLTIPFEEKPKTSMPSDNLRYYRRRNNLTTRQLAEQIGVVPATIVMYENGKHPIPYDVAIKLADVLKIEASLLYDEFSRFLAAPYNEALKSVRTALGLSQKAFAEQIGIVPSYYYKLEEGSRRPSRKVYQQMCVALKETNPQTSLLKEYHLQ
jgi:transcriptional regulator with XRE-family HTH domain